MKIPQFVFDSVAERDLEFIGAANRLERKAKVRLGRPFLIAPEDANSAECWAAPYEIAIEGEDVYASFAFGEDSLQAFQLAERGIGATLRYSFQGEFRWFGDPNLGFPIAGETLEPDIPGTDKK
jgi:hypothetical protein